jgi:hypothetical protein
MVENSIISRIEVLKSYGPFSNLRRWQKATYLYLMDHGETIVIYGGITCTGLDPH